MRGGGGGRGERGSFILFLPPDEAGEEGNSQWCSSHVGGKQKEVERKGTRGREGGGAHRGSTEREEDF